MPTTQIESDQLLNAALKMPEEEFQHFVTELFTLKARERVTALSQRESELLTSINQGLPPADAKRMNELIAKRQDYSLTEEEYQELIRLTDESECFGVERLKHLMELAHLRGITLDEVMEQLDIRPAIL